MKLMARLFISVLIVTAMTGSLERMNGQGEAKAAAPRLVMFIGVDISGSFARSRYFNDSMRFLSHYIYSHLKGYGGLKVPSHIFVGSIGGAKKNESKTFFPIEVFEGKSVKAIERTLKKIFPRNKQNPFTDFNAYFEQVETTVKNRKLVLRPITIVLISDGKPDFPDKGKQKFRRIVLKPLETLSRNITIRLLYTDAETGDDWQSRVPRRRVKIWTQDAQVMALWREPNIMKPKRSLAKQDKFFKWIKSNVDFNVRGRRVK